MAAAGTDMDTESYRQNAAAKPLNKAMMQCPTRRKPSRLREGGEDVVRHAVAWRTAV